MLATVSEEAARRAISDALLQVQDAILGGIYKSSDDKLDIGMEFSPAVRAIDRSWCNDCPKH